ncbi:MAG: hypothetical protein JWN21_2219 [Sphingomonas bacterium]|uniref:hypothetical protein n=1 Tax=Sphingomonas bacterium TaxID=1895847 RepID=UPI0026317180|nr:hypothetical protein [Sphingomonas bacterium]MDB5696676.1 hypothetical protein [Sphingomonas bacterium]
MSRAPVDPERPRSGRPFDRADGYSGQGYTADDEVATGGRGGGAAITPEAGDLPPDAGRRAWTDPRTGEVHGSGTGIGGGSPGEDFDSSGASGDSYPVTGGEHEEGDGGGQA